MQAIPSDVWHCPGTILLSLLALVLRVVVLLEDDVALLHIPYVKTPEQMILQIVMVWVIPRDGSSPTRTCPAAGSCRLTGDIRVTHGQPGDRYPLYSNSRIHTWSCSQFMCI